jgi:hypothetical protein
MGATHAVAVIESSHWWLGVFAAVVLGAGAVCTSYRYRYARRCICVSMCFSGKYSQSSKTNKHDDCLSWRTGLNIMPGPRGRESAHLKLCLWTWQAVEGDPGHSAAQCASVV